MTAIVELRSAYGKGDDARCTRSGTGTIQEIRFV